MGGPERAVRALREQQTPFALLHAAVVAAVAAQAHVVGVLVVGTTESPEAAVAAAVAMRATERPIHRPGGGGGGLA